MSLKEAETIEEKYFRQNAITKSSNKVTIILFIALIIVVSFYGINSYTSNRLNEIVVVGNPYECEQCKKLRSACNKHKGFNVEDALKEKVTTYTFNYTGNSSKEKSIHWAYGDKEYNENCDFCLQSKSECYGCRYNRLVIYETIKELENAPSTYSLYCDDCQKAGYPKCFHCKNQLVTLALNSLSNS